MEDLTGHLMRSSEAVWELQDPALKPLWGWAAGIIDGEGTITILRKKGTRSYELRVGVEMTHHETIQRLRAISNVGGTGPRTVAPGYRVQYYWFATGAQAAGVLRLCLPWLVTKRRQALLALEFYEVNRLISVQGTHKGVPPSVLAKRVAFSKAIKALNQEGREAMNETN